MDSALLKIDRLGSVHTQRKSSRHRNSDRYYFVSENRISVQVGQLPIQPNILSVNIPICCHATHFVSLRITG